MPHHVNIIQRFKHLRTAQIPDGDHSAKRIKDCNGRLTHNLVGLLLRQTNKHGT